MILGTPDVEMKKPRHFECRRVIKTQGEIERGNDATDTIEA